MYVVAPTQLTAIADYVYEKEFYGKNGVETGTLGVPDNSFADTNAEIVYKIQNAYDNMEPRILTDDDKIIDKNAKYQVRIDKTIQDEYSKTGFTNLATLLCNLDLKTTAKEQGLIM